ncbi:Protoheme IX farnesyltransferase, mitochondrial [Coemansia spiralis]|uniref:Protoheme IX farnesyltransferase, mitochondrial n=2 Tax=Coemansia TaxID=4863 RepID=A0A9W8G5Q1_9FUNG|nr:UbiA prenyltransferase family-domain-containing protein [Coemansia spiralis]KAJ1992062.1 Protoheme IX farnesyltransferase, mitochondrial [Coemansia umbellata]KAJ2621435.1 Protoheme IX farnesyltransferase, mitochondrial [Coemansia sp. RSA 1358]KAJ2674410.1 Protoheme IX farnesyltransferase, mitochondrial [Coemansia spiralis]
MANLLHLCNRRFALSGLTALRHTTAAQYRPASSNRPMLTNNNIGTVPRAQWKLQALSRTQLPHVYSDLSKGKLTGFVVLTAMAGYAIAPGATHISVLLWTSLGTAMCSASANSFNQWIEVPYDAQMARTRNRPLVRHLVEPGHSLLFGLTTGALGTLVLYGVSPLAGLLGFTNIALYAVAYTGMKRLSIVNTWVGSLVGAIPPLIGCAAAGALGPEAWVLAGIMFAWQFPHFNSLAHTLRAEYSKAGYRMMSVARPRLNARVALRYSLLMFPLSALLPIIGLTDPWFVVDSSVVNAYMAVCALGFWRHPDTKHSRRLFFSSLVHLPVLLMLIMGHKLINDREKRK